MKKKKRYIFFFAIFIIFIGFRVFKDIQAYHMRASSEEYRLIDDVMKKYGTGIYPLEVSIDKEGKDLGYYFKQKQGLGIFRKDLTWEDIETMRELMNSYLAEHPDSYLNDNYLIYVNIQQANQAPWIAFTNNKSHLQIEGVDGLYDRLDCIIIDGFLKTGNSVEIPPVQVFKGARGFYFDYAPDMEHNYETLSQMDSVEYYNAQPLEEELE